MIKKTEFVVVALTPKNGVLFTHPFSLKKDAVQAYQSLCEESPKKHYKIVKRQIIEETIAESDDYRQAIFAFAN